MKKVISLVIIIFTLLSMPVMASYNDYCAKQLKEINVFQGTDNGFELDREPTRIEGLIMFIRLLGKEEEVLEGNYTHPFGDVPDWANNYVGWAYENGYTQGVSTSEFGVGNMEARSYFTFMLRALGYDDSNGDFTWSNSIVFCKEIGIINDLESDMYGTKMFLRDDVAKISYMILDSKNKKGVKLAEQLSKDGSLDASKLASMGIEIDKSIDQHIVKTIEYDDGSVYKGEFLNGVRDGSGEFTLESGSFYKGKFVNDAIEGYGESFMINIGTYIGYFKDGKEHGQGKLSLVDGKVYEGEFINTMFTGQGVYTLNNEAGKFIIKGNFIDFNLNGQGEMSYPEGSTYKGEFVDNIPKGQGELIYPDGNVYKGEYDNLPNGQGETFYTNGDHYKGGFTDGAKSGYGEFTLANGDYLKGEFADVILVKGIGQITSSNGAVYTGEYANNEEHGHGKIVKTNGEYLEGTFYYGSILKAIGIITLPDGSVYEGEFANDNLNGVGRITLPNGQIYEGIAFDGAFQATGLLN